MSSVQHLREFIRERLTAAAEEIFSEVQKTIVRYQEELDGQRKIMFINWNPQVKLSRINMELRIPGSAAQQYDCKDVEHPTMELHSSHDGTSSLDQEEPESPQLKEEPGEQEEPCSSQDGEQLVLKLEPVYFLETPSHEEKDFPEAEPVSHDSLFQCDVCGKAFKSKYNTQRHRRMHLGLKPFVCTICGKRFSQKYHLNSHLRIHTGQWPFYCKTCGRGCSDSRGLNMHMKTHSGEKLFACEICGKKFTQIPHLKTHQRTHTGEKPYCCLTCGKKFTYKISLTAHIATHTGEKPFSCSVCGKEFNTASRLYIHKKMHKNEKPNVV